jgi:predicted TIM-barrel fold metal-dependent hydrolase
MPIEPAIDCHVHVFDPARFPYGADAWYRPLPSEAGTAVQLAHLLDTHHVRHALIVGPNSGYGLDNRCLLDALAQGRGRYKGVAVVPNDASASELQDLQAQGVVGVAFNVALQGTAFYADTAPLLQRLRDLGLWAQVQVQDDQLSDMNALLLDSGVRVVFDHCGRPRTAAGVAQTGFQTLLQWAQTGRACVKLSIGSQMQQTAKLFFGTPQGVYLDGRPTTQGLDPVQPLPPATNQLSPVRKNLCR